MALHNEQWFIHAVSDNVIQLAQQKKSKIMGTMRSKEGVVGKTYPFNTIGATSLIEVARDMDTVYLNPPQGKRRVVLVDFAGAVLIDEFDEIKTLTSPQSEHAQILAYARNRKIDDLALGVPGLGVAGAAGTAVGGILGLASTVSEPTESSATVALPTAQQIVNGGTGLTMAKLRQAVRKLQEADMFDEDEFHIAYTPAGISQLMGDTTVTSGDYNNMNLLQRGEMPEGAIWMGLHWHMSNRVPTSAANIRSLPVWAKNAVGYAAGLVKEVEASIAPHKWNNTQVITKLSAGVVRIDDKGVVQIDIDESVGL
jgi:hypothetical protein